MKEKHRSRGILWRVLFIIFVLIFLAVLELIRNDNWKAAQEEDGDIMISAALGSIALSDMITL